MSLVLAAAALAFDMAGGVRPMTSLAFWGPWALGAGILLGVIRELSRNTVTSISSLGKHRGYGVLGAAPELTQSELRQLPPDMRTPLDVVIFQPASAFATALRDLQSAVEQDHLVAFIAALPGEGATTVALATAASATQQGRRVIIIDCDLRGRTLTRSLVSEPNGGVLEATQNPSLWRQFAVEEAETGFHLLPAARPGNPWASLTGGRDFRHLLAQLQDAYDLIILDCPPALGSPDGGVLASLADKCVLVTAWDRTPVSYLRRTIDTLRSRSRVVTGLYVNRVPPSYRFGRLRPS